MADSHPADAADSSKQPPASPSCDDAISPAAPLVDSENEDKQWVVRAVAPDGTIHIIHSRAEWEALKRRYATH